MRKLGAAVLGVLLVVGVLAAGVAVLQRGRTPARVTAPPLASLAPAASAPEDLARAACTQLRLAAQGIQAGSAAASVRTQLASARALAAQAVREEGRWAGLSGGIAALDEAVRRDEPETAAAGLQVALQQCASLSP